MMMTISISAGTAWIVVFTISRPDGRGSPPR
jgi:hypothetical protein